MAQSSEQDSADSKEPLDDDERILSDAKEHFRLAEDAESEIRRLAIEDARFRAGDQWDQATITERQRDGRPIITVNRMPQFIQQVSNDQRQNRPSIKVHPIDDKADLETAKTIQGLIRHIEYRSNADVAYDTGFDSAATGGFGYWRILPEYVSPTSFDQELAIKRIRNPHSVFWDPHAQEPDGSDANKALIVDEFSKEEYKSMHPDSKLANCADWESIGNTSAGWISGNTCRVAEYFYREWTMTDLAQMPDGKVLPLDQVPADHKQFIVKTRKSRVPKICWVKLNGHEILEKTDWPGKFIPIVPILGTELFIEGRRILEGVIRHAKDSQRMYNYWSAAETEAIALAPRTPFIMVEGQDEGYETEWKMANRRNYSRLIYKNVSLNGQNAPPPQRNQFEPAVAQITQAKIYSGEDMKNTTGIYDAALGQRSNETSGIAIRNRAQQAQTSNFHFIDNLTRSIRHTGRILIDLIPKIYDTERTVRIVGEEGDQKVVKVNTKVKPDGQQQIYALDTGEYDVTVDVGPAIGTKRQEAAQSMMELTKAYPQIAQIAGDLIVKNMDWPGASEIADRLKKTLPPGLAEDSSKDKLPIPPKVQAQMQQMNQMIDQLTNELKSSAELVHTKKMELESRERIEFAKLNVNAELEMAKMGSAEAIVMLKSEIQEIDARQQQFLNMYAPIGESQQGGAQPRPQPQYQPQGPAGPPMGPPMDAGAMGIDPMAPPQGVPFAGAGEPSGYIPTGGASPGQPLETPLHDDPNSVNY